MLASIVFISSNNKFRKEQRFERIAGRFRKRILTGLVFAIGFTQMAVPAFAASVGDEALNTSPGTGIPIWKLGVVLIELIILGIIWKFIVSDLSVIRWFEKKKKSRL